jgi:hypothetical protein
VKAYRYHDQMSGTPIRDEQGTRDRPYDLIVDFDERKIDDLLAALGLKPWLSHRPRLAVLAGMELGARNYMVTADAGPFPVAPRQSLLAAAIRRGLIIVLPDEAALAKSGLDAGGLAKMSPTALAARAAELGGEVALVGRLKWDDSDLAWATEWRMEWQGRPHRWQVRGPAFDDAFRRALGGAAQILSGNGDPDSWPFCRRRTDFTAGGMSPGRAACLNALRFAGLLGSCGRAFRPFHRGVFTTDALEVGASGEGDNRDHSFSAFRAEGYPIHERPPDFSSPTRNRSFCSI